MTSESSPNPARNHSVAPVPIEGDPRWALVLRIAASRQFAKAPQVRDILVYICQRALMDPGAGIREYEIGCNALGRKVDFSPNEDNIVRVQVSHLRKKLDEYFAAEGKEEPLRISVPKGGYVPHFEPRVEIVAAPDPSLAKADSAPPASPGSRRSFAWIVALAVSTGLLAIACLYLALHPLAAPAASQPRASQPMRQDPFWSRVFGPGQQAGIVVADSCLVMLQDILHTDLSVAEYLSHQYPEELLNQVPSGGLRSALELIASRQYTSLADINIASRLVELSLQFGGSRAPIRYARHMNIRDFKTENLILIGSRRGVPWVQLFEPQMNFYFEEKKAAHQFYLRNKRPKPGELATYVPMERGGVTETYAVIALLPNLGNTGAVLVLSGISMVASEAAGEWVARKEFSQELTDLLGPQAVREQYFEVLLKTRAVAGASRNSEIVTYRLIRPGETGN